MKNIKELKPVLHFKKDNYVYRYVLVDRFKHGPKYHYGFDTKEDHPEVIKGFAKIASMMQEDKIVATESENVNTTKDLESEISAIMNDKNHPYHIKGHPDHDKSVQQLLTLREMLHAK